MQKSTKRAIATALQSIATVLREDADSMPDPTNLFDYEAVGVNPKEEVKVTKTQSELDEADRLNDLFHETVGKSGRTLNHSLNKVRSEWKYKNIRTPRGPRAIAEVAVDCGLKPEELAAAIAMHPVFSANEIGEAAKQLIV